MFFLDELYLRLRRLPEYLPNGLKERLRGTVVDDAYSRFYKWRKIKVQKIQPRSVEIPGNGTYEFLVPIPSSAAEEIERTGVYEPVLTRDLYDELSETAVFFDIGCYFGYFTQLADAAGVPPENIYGFEGDPDRIDKFREVHEGSYVTDIRGFVGDGSTDGSFSVDDFVEENRVVPTVVKIDVEGMEYQVLNGMQRVIEEHHPLLYIEMHPHVFPRFETDVGEIVELLTDAGYELKVHYEHQTDTGNGWVTANPKSLPKHEEIVEKDKGLAYLLKAE